MSLLPTLEDPRLLPLLPAIYVAWADGELSVDAFLIPDAVLAAPISR